MGDKKTKALVIQWFKSQLKRAIAPEKVLVTNKQTEKRPNQNKWVDADVGKARGHGGWKRRYAKQAGQTNDSGGEEAEEAE